MSDQNPAIETQFKEPKRWRVHHLMQAKQAGRKITMITAYDALTAPIFEEAGIDTILVGDSYGNVQLGYGSTIPVTIEDMERATGAVARSVTRPLVVADMPFGTYEASPQVAFDNAARLIRVGANAVKFEGGAELADTVKLLTQAGIPVVGHLGFTPNQKMPWAVRACRARYGKAEGLTTRLPAVCRRDCDRFGNGSRPVASEVTKARMFHHWYWRGPETDGQAGVVRHGRHDRLGSKFVKSLAKRAQCFAAVELRGRGEGRNLPGPENYKTN